VPVAVGGTVSNAPRVVYAAPAVVVPRVVVAPPVVYQPYPVVYGPRQVVVVPQRVVHGPPAHAVDRRGWKANRWHARHGGRYGPHRD
jgi:hypothetical protein